MLFMQVRHFLEEIKQVTFFLEKKTYLCLHVAKMRPHCKNRCTKSLKRDNIVFIDARRI